MKLQFIKSRACICGNNEYLTLCEIEGFDSKFINKIDFSVVKCCNCGLARTYPPPFINDETADVHISSTEYYSVLKDKESYIDPAERIIKAIRRRKRSGTLLDIGCGVGILLEVANKKYGYQGVGLEINHEAAEYGKEKLGVKIISGSIRDVLAENNKFDIVVLSHILEHIVEPIKFLEMTRQVLKSSGIIAVEVPDFRGFIPQVLTIRGKYWYGFQPTQHVWQFTHVTLEDILKKAGFMILDTYRNKNLNHRFNNDLKGSLSRFVYSLAARLSLGDRILVIGTI